MKFISEDSGQWGSNNRHSQCVWGKPKRGENHRGEGVVAPYPKRTRDGEKTLWAQQLGIAWGSM